MLESGTKHHDMERLFATTVEGIRQYHYCGTRSSPDDHPRRGAGSTSLADGGVRGMMISRRPNRRASTDHAPGPKQTTAAATTAAKIVGNVPSNGFGAGGGNQERTAPIAPSPTTAPPRGVRNPRIREAPPDISSRPMRLVRRVRFPGSAKYDPPSMTAVAPVAARNSNR